MEYLPSKRFTISALAVVVLGSGLLIYNAIWGSADLEQLTYTENGAAAVAESLDHKALLESEYLGVGPDKKQGDLSLSGNNAIAAQKEYGVEIAAIMREFSTASRNNEPELMFKALEAGNKKEALVEIEKIKDLAEIYRRTALNLTALKVPTELAPIHLKITNAVSRLEVHVANMGAILEDPVKAITSADEYVRESRALYAALAELNTFFEERNITFSDEERASVTLNEAL